MIEELKVEMVEPLLDYVAEGTTELSDFCLHDGDIVCVTRKDGTKFAASWWGDHYNFEFELP